MEKVFLSERGNSELARLSMPHKCRQCGKIFGMSVEANRWGYTSRLGRSQKESSKKLFCSYKCLREYEKPFIRARKHEIKTIYGEHMYE